MTQDSCSTGQNQHTITNFEFFTEPEFTEEERLLFKRNPAAEPIHGTLKLHAFLTIQKVN
jgi:hypothetical protein